MKNLVNKRIIIFSVILILIFAGLKLLKKQKNKNCITIAIIQTASHPALDATLKGFIETIKTKANNVNFILKNGQGSMADLHTIAQSFANDSSIDAIFAIGTPAAQACAHNEKIKPIFVAAVTDPFAAGIGQPNICGSTDMIDVSKQIDLLQTLVPNVKTVAILFNQSEINAQIVSKKMESELSKRNLKKIKAAVTQESEIPLALDKAIKNGDVILTPIDNTIASSISFIAQKLINMKKPLIVSDNLLVQNGALAAAGVDYFSSGKKLQNLQ